MAWLVGDREMKNKMVSVYLTLGIIAIAGMVRAAYPIYSNTLTVNLSSYTLTLLTSNQNQTQYDHATFTATLDFN